MTSTEVPNSRAYFANQQAAMHCVLIKLKPTLTQTKILAKWIDILYIVISRLYCFGVMVLFRPTVYMCICVSLTGTESRMRAMDSDELNASVDDHLATNGSDVNVQFMIDHGQYDQLGNASELDHVDDGFFTIYFSSTRFTAETVIAMVSAGINAAVLTTLVIGGRCWTHGHHSKTVYRCLFANLAVADCLSSVSMWLGNNVAYLFSAQLASMNICLSIICLSAAFFMSSAFCLAAMMTVLGFAVVQYISICHPLQNMTVVSTKKVSIGIHYIGSITMPKVPYAQYTPPTTADGFGRQFGN